MIRVPRALLSAVFLMFILAESASAFMVDWVAVGFEGNLCDDQLFGCFGAVDYIYRISKTEVTNEQYVEFLNAKAAADPFELYDTRMGSGHGGIIRSGTSGNFMYSTIAGSRWAISCATRIPMSFSRVKTSGKKRPTTIPPRGATGTTGWARTTHPVARSPVTLSSRQIAPIPRSALPTSRVT
jgi:hypothetical protein